MIWKEEEGDELNALFHPSRFSVCQFFSLLQTSCMSHMFIKYWSSEAILEVVMEKKVGEQGTFGKCLVLTTENDTRDIFFYFLGLWSCYIFHITQYVR